MFFESVIPIALSAVVAFGLWKVLRFVVVEWLLTSYVPRRIEKMYRTEKAGLEAMWSEEVDDVEPEVLFERTSLDSHVVDVSRQATAGSATPFIGKRTRSNFTRTMAWEAKAQFPLCPTSRSAAQRMVVKRWVADRCRAHGLREQQIGMLVPRICALWLIPTKEEVDSELLLYAGPDRAVFERKYVTRMGGSWWNPATWMRPSGVSYD